MWCVRRMNSLIRTAQHQGVGVNHRQPGTSDDAPRACRSHERVLPDMILGRNQSTLAVRAEWERKLAPPSRSAPSRALRDGRKEGPLVDVPSSVREQLQTELFDL